MLDNEPAIQEQLRAHRFLDDGRELQIFQFVNSKDEPGVQVSDAPIGLMGKLFTFVMRSNIAAVAAAKNALTPSQGRTLQKLNDLLDRSQTQTQALLEQVASVEAMRA